VLTSLGLGLARSWNVSVDVTVLGFTMACAVVTGLAFGALPAWSPTRGDNADALRGAGGRVTTDRRHLTLRSTLVVTEIALALMLVATAGLLIKGFLRLQEIDPGFVRDNVLTAFFNLPAAKYGTPEKQVLFQQQLLERVRALPGVTSAAYTNDLPFFSPGYGDGSTASYQIDGPTPPAGQPEPRAMVRQVSSDYFKTMGIRLLRGRVFTEQDSRTSDDVVVIDRVFADRYWPGEDPIGKRLIYGSRAVPNSTTPQPRRWEIIGVVAPVKNSSLEIPFTKETIYFSILQGPGGRSLALVMKTAGPPEQLVVPLRAAMHAVDPGQPISALRTMEERIESSMHRRRTPMILLALFAGISLLLAVIGVYGVLAFAVGQRTQEIGVRMALGATRANILQLILSQGVRLAALGIALGLGGYFALSTFIRKLLFSVETTDYAALLLAPALLTLFALAACLIPARRATKVDPIVALRAE
jgi:predicted permease